MTYLKELTVEKFLNDYHKFTGQFVGNDYSLSGNLQKYALTIHEWLNSPTNLIIVHEDGTILSGNTRHQAMRIAVDAGRLALDRTFNVNITSDELTLAEQQIAAMKANTGNIKNKKACMVGSQHESSLKGYGPVFDIIREYTPILTKNRQIVIAKLMTALIDKIGLERMKEIYGNEIYTAKKLPTANEEFWCDYTLSCDFRIEKQKMELLTLILPGLKLIQELYSDKDIKSVIGGVRNLQYLLLALSCRGKLSEKNTRNGKISFQKIKKWLKNPKNIPTFDKIFKEKFASSPDIAETLFLNSIS